MSLLKLGLASMTIGVAFSSSCNEILTVTDANFDFTGVPGDSCEFFDYPCDELIGEYYFNGFSVTGFDTDGDGNDDEYIQSPRYLNPESGAIMDVNVEFINVQGIPGGVLASLRVTYNDANYVFNDGSVGLQSVFSPGWDHFADVTFEQIYGGCLNANTFKYKYIVDYPAVTGTPTIYYPDPSNTGGFPQIDMTVTLADCENIGLDVGPAPTPNPTPDPTPNPVSGPICSSYDTTVYSSCSDDANCINCQSWGCQTCATGYYKMGNYMRCQSCDTNYANCLECVDWNGCKTCTDGSEAAWDATCSDETCNNI